MRAFETEKTEIAEVDRSVYDIKDKVNAAFEVNSGLTAEIVEKISEEKHDPEWMREFRLKALETYNKMSIPNWGPSLTGLDMSNIVTYVRPNTEMRGKWSEVPDDIKNTFERLGIPQAERSSLAGVGAQYDSEVVYHNVKEEVAAQGVIYTDMESALTGPYADMVKEHFMKCVPPTDHKFAALHGAVWSGGSFVYVPAGVHVDIPLQSYFRLNAPGAGQFEHTLIIVDKGAYLHFIEGCSAPKYNVANLHAGCVEIFVGEGARVRYSTIENWSKNMYNLNTKRARVEKGGTIEWVSGSFGSHTGCLYPMSVLQGEGARMEFTGKRVISFSLLTLRLFPGVLLLIGVLYVLLHLGILNTLTGVIVVAIALRLPGSTFIIRNFFAGIPQDIENSALVDGCNRLTAFFQVIIHMVKPGLASISIFAFMSAWSNYLLFNVLIFNTKTPVLATYLRVLSRNDQMIADYGVFAAMAMVYMLPVLIFFFISQRQLMQGTISGGKGI